MTNIRSGGIMPDLIPSGQALSEARGRLTKKSRILALLDAGHSTAEVAAVVGVMVEYVRSCRQRRNGPSVSDRNYAERNDLRARQRERYRQDPEYRERQRARGRDGYWRDPERRKRQAERCRAYRAARKAAQAKAADTATPQDGPPPAASRPPSRDHAERSRRGPLS